MFYSAFRTRCRNLTDITKDKLNFENKVYLVNTHFFKLPVCYSTLNSYLETEAKEGFFFNFVWRGRIKYIYIYIYIYICVCVCVCVCVHTHLETRDMQNGQKYFCISGQIQIRKFHTWN